MRRFIRNYLSGIDKPLFVTVAALCVFSIFNIYGIGGSQNPFFQKQIIFVILGVILMSLFSYFNYRYLKNYPWPVFVLYVGSVILLLAPFLFPTIRGVQSWIVIGVFTFEPAEFMKLAIIILMAKYFSQRHIHINDYRHVIVSGLYCLIPIGITLLQPDLGSAIIMLMIWLGMLVAVGLNRRQIFSLVVLIVIAAVAAWMFALKPYQQTRIVSFLNPGSDPYGSGYNLIQSKIAVGAGGWFGNGWGRGTQTRNGFLPEPYNDFVFSATAEQFGLFGIALILAGIIFIFRRILYIGQLAPSNFGRLFAVGITILIAAHAIIGAGVNVGLFPITGIPFPFISSGGSNLLSLLIGLGILQSIKRYS
ncbi:MAG: Rod shape-determining protein [Candidatus Yanofskybacteria bacterium GW2011_GWA1_48_10]|uniref:Probable peptidoglycan glycosyltransferase FtsW n=2 Tax=Candidatus Yanofskyibacteriota TaxID=1752733 RepID=A0A0G1U789_9BACT|nr:MAG: Rod shape-determining protein [Candidatus Yanofskybacteria bacterium GW2011_GWA1_48_10]OGN06727.1 MAG: hypothetical protein A2669_00120 [Candidatus Yanofskybacteria bacterium RIFCSPHIGHO2_01_FULL_48_25b]